MDSNVSVDRNLLIQANDLLLFFLQPRRRLCTCSDGPMCEICRTIWTTNRLGELICKSHAEN